MTQAINNLLAALPQPSTSYDAAHGSPADGVFSLDGIFSDRESVVGGLDLGDVEMPSFMCTCCRQTASISDAFPLGRCPCLLCRPCLVSRTGGVLAEALAALQNVPAQMQGTSMQDAVGAALPAFPLCGLPCPACGLADGLDRADILELCGASLRLVEEAAAEAKLGSLARCPACGAGVEMQAVGDVDLPEGLRPTGIPEFDRTLPRRFAQTDLEGRPISREALLHRERHRFRCTCRTDFCGNCRVTPYHLGFTCEAWADWISRPDCTFCSGKATSVDALLALAPTGAGSSCASSGRAMPRKEVRVGGRAADAAGERPALLRQLEQAVSAVPLKALRRELLGMGIHAVDACLERRDVELLACSVHSCSAPACRGRLSASCLRVLPCGHLCSGCRGEPSCPPCLSCRRPAGGHTDDHASSCCPYCSEPVPPGPAIHLDCGHVVHAACLSQRLGVADKTVWQPPQCPLSFEFRCCPVCRTRIGDLPWPQDVALALRQASALEKEVTTRAVKRLKVDPRHRRDDAILPGGTFEGRPRDYALTLYQYHLCESCSKPYFGGERRCEPAEPAPGDGARHAGAAGNRDKQRLCGGCAALKAGKMCPKGHDPSFLEWKCQRCCSVASWFCWGTTHFCNRCHQMPYNSAVPCPGAAQCPFGGQHPPNGSNEPFCLGCSLCRHSDIT